MLRDGNRRVFGRSSGNNPAFFLPLNDLGSGRVNTTPGIAFPGTTATFTRATSATCWGPTGLLITVGSGVARSTYTELTGASYLGYLAEEARTNNVIQNRDFTNAAWTNTNMTAAKDQVGIDGVANSASSLLATAGNATSAQTVTIAAVNRPFSVYVKRLVGTGNIDLAQDGASFTTQTVANDGAWHRCTLVASQLNPALTIRLATNTDKIAVDFAMLEDSGGAARTFALSPIATTTVAVTRNADILKYPPTGNASNTAGTGYAEITGFAGTVGAAAGFVIGLDATFSGRVLERSSVQTSIDTFDGTSNPTKSGLPDYSLGIVKVASSWGASGLNVTGAGLTPATSAFDGTMGDGTALSIGCANPNGNQFCGTIKNVRLWTTQRSNAELQGFTA